ncbi:hypothetical protein M409DRAFT_17328 [Zasmidium cellare ATCC 36951]|uniref:AB hydrolase-1 domain-containing protein n=1 Tax=Zasmidium cellare ATCC 36951 TaxID=1080233 RepID=A0A6A6D348_ZASCE|nr:uncharacterized protein M409DRAFT_17328 [Zasmidium cellare ATCC 36951]KAF2172086.1 hypothetical protein M409DRAFT_17328 [Zasmidium cellare ATCC 36951]
MAWPNVYRLDSRQLERRPAARPRPTIIIAHDAFHTPAHFEQLQQDLAAAGFRVVVPQLPSSGVAGQSATLEDDVQTLVLYGKAEIENGHNVVLVAHGYGSIPGAAAAERLNQHSLDRPRTGTVTRLILIAGVVSRVNESYYDSVEAAWAVARDGLVAIRNPSKIFYNDCSPETTATALTNMRPQSESSLWAKSTTPGWMNIPTFYVVCEADQAIAPSLQQGFVRTLQSVNGRVTVANMQAGHCPFLSRGREVAALVVRQVLENL